MNKNRKHMRAAAMLAAFCLAVALTAAACNDNPTTVGSGYQPDKVDFHAYRFTAADFEILSDVAGIANGSNEGGIAMLVGRADDGSVAHGLMALSGPSPLMEGSGARELVSATLNLKNFGYAYGDTVAKEANYEVVVLDQVFGDRVKWSDALAADIENAPVLGSFKASYEDTAAVSITLDRDAASQFLKEFYRRDTTYSPNGSGGQDTVVEVVTLKTLALRAGTDAKTIVSVVGATFQGLSQEYQPALELELSGDTTTSIAMGVTSWIVTSPEAVYGEDIITVAGGLPVRTYLKLNLDVLPPQAVIHQAALELYVNPERSRHGTYGPVTFAPLYLATANSLSKEGNLYLSTASSYIRLLRTPLDSTSYTDTFRSGSFAPTITGWLRDARGAAGLENYGMVLQLNRLTSIGVDRETSSLDRVVYYGFDEADTTRHPSLTIVYSLQTDAN